VKQQEDLMKRLLSIVVIMLALALHPLVSAASDSDNPLDACQNPSPLVLITKLDVNRVSGSPNRNQINFRSASSGGLLCIENHGATSAGVSINGSAVVAPGDFAGAPALIARFITLQQTNKLIATISGLPGHSFTVYIYGLAPADTV
jgi:hypothetical protein